MDLLTLEFKLVEHYLNKVSMLCQYDNKTILYECLIFNNDLLKYVEYTKN